MSVYTDKAHKGTSWGVVSGVGGVCRDLDGVGVATVLWCEPGVPWGIAVWLSWLVLLGFIACSALVLAVSFWEVPFIGSTFLRVTVEDLVAAMSDYGWYLVSTRFVHGLVASGFVLSYAADTGYLLCARKTPFVARLAMIVVIVATLWCTVGARQVPFNSSVFVLFMFLYVSCATQVVKMLSWGGMRAAGCDGVAVGAIAVSVAGAFSPVIGPVVALGLLHLISYGRVRSYYSSVVNTPVDERVKFIALVCTRLGLPAVEEHKYVKYADVDCSETTPSMRACALVGDRALSLACALDGMEHNVPVAKVSEYAKGTENANMRAVYDRRVVDILGVRGKVAAATVIEAVIGVVFLEHGIVPVREFMAKELSPDFKWSE